MAQIDYKAIERWGFGQRVKAKAVGLSVFKKQPCGRLRARFLGRYILISS